MKEDFYEQIEKYLAGKMSADELQAFEQQLEKDDVLRQELELYPEVKAAILKRINSEQQKSALINTLDNLNTKYFPEKEKSTEQNSQKSAPPHPTPEEPFSQLAVRRRLYRMVAVAAAILLLVLVIWQPWSQDLYTKFAQHPRAQLAERNSELALSQIERAFNNADYEAALSAFELLSPDQVRNDGELLLLQGISYLEQDRAADARRNFRILHASDSEMQDDGTWYLGLSFVKEGVRDSSMFYLEQIGGGSEYYGWAKRLVGRME